jgi:RNA polymerase sigma-70 factor (ECF subfamily)
MVKPWEIDLSVYDDETALLEGLRQKDRLACTCLLKRFAPRLYRLALQLTGEPDEAEDVLQEAFIQACSHVADFEGRSGLATWLHRIVLNTALARMRRKSLATVSLDMDRELRAARAVGLVDPAAGPSDAVLTRELGEVLERAILALPDSLRAAFVLRDVEGLSTREAAAALGMGESALKVRLHRARAALRGMLAPTINAVGVEAENLSLSDELEHRLLDRVCPPFPTGSSTEAGAS